MAGHFYTYDAKNMSGTFKISFTNGVGVVPFETYQMVDLEKFNTIYYYINKNYTMSFYGDLLINFTIGPLHYNVTGLLYEYPHPTSKSQKL